MSIDINIVSGFLGAGKTTFLKKIIPVLYGKTALIENEFGEIGIDAEMIGEGLPVREIYAGCICCSVAHDFKHAIEELSEQYRPDHIFIEPSGVGSLSDILKICRKVSEDSDTAIRINHLITIVDVTAYEDYSENFGGFYMDQIRNANVILLSHFEQLAENEIEKIISKIRIENPSAFILSDEWYSLEGEELIGILDSARDSEMEILDTVSVSADEVFGTISVADPRVFSEEEIENMSASLKGSDFGLILRAKGRLKLDSDPLIYFDFTPQHYRWEYIEDRQPKLAVIGSNLDKEKILKWFGK